MDIQADKIIERYAQALAEAQQQLFIAQAAIEALNEEIRVAAENSKSVN